MVKQVTNERLEHLWGKALTIASKKYRGWLFEALQGIKAERSTVVELEADRDSWKHKACANGWKTEFERAEAAEAQLAALPKWAQSSESKGQFYRKSIQEMAALREQLAALRKAKDNPECAVTNLIGGAYNCCGPRLKRLLREERDKLTALREGLEGLAQKWCEEENDYREKHYGPSDMDVYDYAEELRALLTKTTPTVNSAGAVNGGEDSETPQQFTASLIEKRGEHFASLVMEALEDAL